MPGWAGIRHRFWVRLVFGTGTGLGLYYWHCCRVGLVLGTGAAGIIGSDAGLGWYYWL